LKSSGSRQLTFAFTDRSEPNVEPEAATSEFGSEVDRYASELAGREYLLFRAQFKAAGEPDAEVVDPDSLLESIARMPNLAKALLKVSSNKGASGIDGKSVDEVVEEAHKVIPRLKVALLSGIYQPGDIRRVWIPKPGGGERGLGIPNVIDRVVQQAVLQILGPLIEPSFHDSSHGFRPKRGAQTAIAEATKHLTDGYSITVDIDLSKFFDRVHHQRLLSRLAKWVPDGRVLKLIHRMLKAKVVLPDGTRISTIEGAPQGGPLSPLLSNVVLDELDQELSRRRLRFVRYADDFSIFVRSERAGERVMASVRKFIEKRLRLVVNDAKSSVSEPYRLTFLGFQFGRNREGDITLGLSERTLERVKTKLRELTPRNWGNSFKACTEGVQRYLTGWLGYFRLSTTGRIFETLDAHIRRRLRQILASQKKRPRHLYRHLLNLGVAAKSAANACYHMRSPWKRSASHALHRAYSNAWFSERIELLHVRWLLFQTPPPESVSKQRLLFE
jgi:group II intron reverse transcriptase/maturase